MFDLTVGTMAQCYDRGSICACRPVSYENNKMSRLLTIPQTNSYYNADVVPNNSAILDNDMKQSNTLQSVLLGKVPAAYSHLTSHRKSPYPLSPPQSISPRSPHSPNSYLDIPLMSPCNGPPQSFQISQEMPYSMSPHRSTISSPHMPSPRPSPHTVLSPHPSSSPHSSPSPASTCSTDNCQEEPIDLSCKIVKEENTPSEDKEDSGFSLLRNLLCVGKSSQERSPKTSENCDQLDNESCVGMQVTGTTPVTLAKKNMYPVGSRVSDWLVKIIQFAKSIPEFVNLSHNDKVTLILNSWTRLLLLYMSESNFQFAVTPIHSEQHSADDSEAPPPTQPTMKSVENLQGFIRKCQTMNLDQKEYAFLRMAVLFNSGYVGLDRPDLVEQLNSLIQQLLQEHAKSTRPNDVLHYSRLLLCLPALYGINCKMVENLFCKHINGNMDIDVLLKEMLQNL